jgi:hypothetical protein
MGPGTRQIKFFDTKIQMFKSLFFYPKITNSEIETPKKYSASKQIYTSKGKKWGR